MNGISMRRMYWGYTDCLAGTLLYAEDFSWSFYKYFSWRCMYNRYIETNNWWDFGRSRLSPDISKIKRKWYSFPATWLTFYSKNYLKYWLLFVFSSLPNGEFCIGQRWIHCWATVKKEIKVWNVISFCYYNIILSTTSTLFSINAFSSVTSKNKERGEKPIYFRFCIVNIPTKSLSMIFFNPSLFSLEMR